MPKCQIVKYLLNIVLFYSTREYNSGLPSSAACERLFSTAGLIFTAKRCNLSDLNFEMLVFLKLNGACCREWGNQPSKTSGNSKK
jgi:hypothetical protein